MYCIMAIFKKTSLCFRKMHYFEPLPIDIKKEIFQRCDKTEAEIAKDVQSIQQWLKTQPHLPDLLSKVNILMKDS